METGGADSRVSVVMITLNRRDEAVACVRMPGAPYNRGCVDSIVTQTSQSTHSGGQIVAAAEEERFTRRKHGKAPVPYSTRELPEQSMAWCLAEADLPRPTSTRWPTPTTPCSRRRTTAMSSPTTGRGCAPLFAQRAPLFLCTALPGLDPDRVVFVPTMSPTPPRLTWPAARSTASGKCSPPRLPHSLGLFYEEVTAHLGIAPGPRSAAEIVTMLVTSIVLPAAATGHWLRGWFGVAVVCWIPAVYRRDPAHKERRVGAVLFDRDGTLVVDQPYNGDPARVEPMPGARAALDRLRAAGVPTAVVSNQSGVARGLLTMEQVQAVNRRIEELLGPLGPWLVCPHGSGDGCACRKPAPGLVRRAAALLGVQPRRCVLIGDIGSDVEAARAATRRRCLWPAAGCSRPATVAARPRRST